MANHSTGTGQETTDEDAAVLQFPKEVQYHCFACSVLLEQTFIVCDECPGSVCLACFAKGREGNGSIHSSNHRYRIFRDEMPLFDDWSARDELNLLNLLIELGPSNWIEVAKKLKMSNTNCLLSSTECERHYTNSYLEYPHAALPRPPSPERLYRPLPITYKWGTHDPPRPIPGSTYHRDMAGYCAARGDFHVEMFNNAEMDVSSLQFDTAASSSSGTEEENDEEEEKDSQEDQELLEALKIGVIQVYNDKLKERCRRKRIIQEHGLINMHRHMAARYRYDSVLTHRICEGLSPLAQLLKFQDFSKLLEGLHAHAELKQRIRQLQKYRHLGIKTLAAAEFHLELQTERHKRQKQLKQFTANLHSVFPHMQQPMLMAAVADQTATGSVVVVNQRRSAPPLDIVGLPGYDNLNEGERQLCSVSRLVPASYIEFRNILISECRNRQGIRLAQARTLIKIDVNKTRKIFDYLLEEKLIHLPLTS